MIPPLYFLLSSCWATAKGSSSEIERLKGYVQTKSVGTVAEMFGTDLTADQQAGTSWTSMSVKFLGGWFCKMPCSIFIPRLNQDCVTVCLQRIWSWVIASAKDRSIEPSFHKRYWKQSPHGSLVHRCSGAATFWFIPASRWRSASTVSTPIAASSTGSWPSAVGLKPGKLRRLMDRAGTVAYNGGVEPTFGRLPNLQEGDHWCKDM